MPISILAIGKKHEDWVITGINRYETRLKPPFKTSWNLIPHSPLPEDDARRDESKLILGRLHSDDFVVLLDERGKLLSSPDLSGLIIKPLNSSKNLVFIIGGAYGVDQSIVSRADYVWSLSSLVFPHQLVRLMLVEQIYRAQEIDRGGGYHHE